MAQHTLIGEGEAHVRRLLPQGVEFDYAVARGHGGRVVFKDIGRFDALPDASVDARGKRADHGG